MEPHPVTGKAFQSDEDWRQWCRRTSWWEWKQLVYVRSERNVFRAHFNARPKVVHVSPWLHFSTLGDPARYFTSCRHGLLAYCAFPNRHPHMGSASAIQELDDAAASALFESFVTADDAQRERWAWNSPPFFLPRAWRAAAAADARHVRAAQRKAKAQAKPGCQAAPVWDFGGEDPIPNHEPLPTAGRAPLAEQGQDRTQNAGGADGAALFTDAPHAEPNHNFQHTWEGLSAKAKKQLERTWAHAEQEEAHELSMLTDDDGALLRRATEVWLRKQSWGARELHDALVSLGSALPRRLSRRTYLDRLRTTCADPKVMRAPGGAFLVTRLKATLHSLRLGVAGAKAQLVDRLCFALREPKTLGDADAQIGHEADAPQMPDGLESDLARSSAVTGFAARAAAAWQEYSGDGMHVLDDDLDTLIDAEEADVRAEQEALLQLVAGVNPPDLDPSLLLPPVPVLSAGACKQILRQGPLDVPRVGATLLYERLDPTQRACHDRVAGFARKLASAEASDRHGVTRPPEPFRLLLLGTAGTGKSDTIKAIVQSAEDALGFVSVLRCAHTGVAAYNMGPGAETVNSAFGLGAKLGPELLEVLLRVRLVIIDEVSMLGSEQLYHVSQRLEEVARVRWRKRRPRGRPEADGRLKNEPDNFGGFGGTSVLLVGDFAQIPPIGDPSLITPAKGQAREAAAGQRLFQQFTEVIRLRRVYRQEGKSPLKDSTLRLRDGAMTLDDYALWAQHDLAGTLREPGDEHKGTADVLHEEALWLVTENKFAGARNGEKLVQLADAHALSVVAIDAEHNDARAASRPPDEFRQLRTRAHLAVGARVMLTSNQLWDERTVQAGLMNGARGVVVGIVFQDGHPPPALPLYVVVDFPGYRGRPFWDDHPTWVPVPPVSRRSKRSVSLERRQLPLRLAWALTVHKSQGLTCPEGIVVDLHSSSATRLPAASPGLAFVAFTRVTAWGRMGFRSLPSFGDFLAVRATKIFQARVRFEENMDALHERTLRAWAPGMTADVEADRHVAYSTAAAASRGQPFGAEDAADVRRMLARRGVCPVPEDVSQWAAKTLKRNAVSFADVLATFRGEKLKVTFGLRPASRSIEASARPNPPCTGLAQPTAALASPPAPLGEQTPALGRLLALGFEPMFARCALEAAAGDFATALDFVMSAGAVCPCPNDPLRGRSLHEEYVHRALTELGLHVEVIDLGIAAGPPARTNACQWLSCVAALSRVFGPADPMPEGADSTLWDAVQADLAIVRATPAAALRREARATSQDAVGVAADYTRGFVCNAMVIPGLGPEAGLDRWLQTFAVGGSVARYRRCLVNMRTTAFADHHTLVEIAELFRVRILVVPDIPAPRGRVLKIDHASEQPGRTLVLGNNNLHYVWLAPRNP